MYFRHVVAKLQDYEIDIAPALRRGMPTRQPQRVTKTHSVRAKMPRSDASVACLA